MIWIPILISTVSLLLTVFTFYLTQLRPAKIDIIAGPEIFIYHGDFPDLSTGIYVPITFTNFSPNMGIINKCGISILRDDTPQTRHFIIWREFVKNIDNEWRYDSEPQSFALQGKSSISKVAWFMWFPAYTPKLIFTEGKYRLLIHVWMGTKKMPLTFRRNFYISKECELTFKSRIENESRTSRRIILDEEIDRNAFLTDTDARKILDD